MVALLLPPRSYVTRTGTSAFRNGENAALMKHERRIPAGINWAKTTMVPKVRKKQTPKSPIPLTPPS